MELGKLLTAADVAEILGKHPRTVLVLAERGELQAVRLGHRTVRFQASDVQDYINRHRTAVAPWGGGADARTRKAQKLPPKVRDVQTARKVAALLVEGGR